MNGAVVVGLGSIEVPGRASVPVDVGVLLARPTGSRRILGPHGLPEAQQVAARDEQR